MYNVKGTISELTDEENYVLKHMGEYSLRACYGKVPVTNEMFDTLTTELEENNCFSLLFIFLENYVLITD